MPILFYDISFYEFKFEIVLMEGQFVRSIITKTMIQSSVCFSYRWIPSNFILRTLWYLIYEEILHYLDKKNRYS